MPVYEFECQCGKITEALVRMNTEQVECPKCHKMAKKIISPCTFELNTIAAFIYSATKKAMSYP
jgi:putative FmdB family regulatory protein